MVVLRQELELCEGGSSNLRENLSGEALEVMCGELHMTGVLVATKDKRGMS